jgi:hypothetical protein
MNEDSIYALYYLQLSTGYMRLRIIHNAVGRTQKNLVKALTYPTRKESRRHVLLVDVPSGQQPLQHPNNVSTVRLPAHVHGVRDFAMLDDRLTKACFSQKNIQRWENIAAQMHRVNGRINA